MLQKYINSKYELVINSKYATKYNGTAAVGYNKYEHVSYTNYVITFDSASLISIDMIDGEYMFPMTWKYNDLKDILKGKSDFALNFDDVFSTNSVVRSRRDNYERTRYITLRLQFLFCIGRDCS